MVPWQCPSPALALKRAGAEEGKVQRKPQKAFTSTLEMAWFDEVDAAFKSLPGGMARAAWLNVDRFSTQWVSAVPSSSLGLVLGNGVFA